jgi:hypothetical protein
MIFLTWSYSKLTLLCTQNMYLRKFITRLASVAFATTLAMQPVFSQNTGIAPITLPIGNQIVRIPAPAGFAETSRRSRELWTTALAFSAGDARIIAHFVTDNDLAEYEKGEAVVFSNFLLVQTPKQAEAIFVTQTQFDKLRSGTVALQADLAQRLEPRLATELDRVSKAVSSNQATDIKVQLGEIVPVSVERNDRQVLIYTVLAQAGISEGSHKTSQTLVASTAYCFIAGKVVMLVVYRKFSTPQDLQAAREQISTWAKAVLASN